MCCCRHIQRKSDRLRRRDCHDRLFARQPGFLCTYAFAWGSNAGRLRDIVGELGISATIAGFGGIFVLYFTDGPISGYRDLLRNDDNAYITFHRRMTDAGFLMLHCR